MRKGWDAKPGTCILLQAEGGRALRMKVRRGQMGVTGVRHPGQCWNRNTVAVTAC